MTSFMQSSAKHFLTIKAAREIGQEIEKAGLDNLKTLADNGVSIVGTYLKGCSPSEKARHKRDLGALLQMGITPDMLLDEVVKLMPKIAPLIEGREGYKLSEVRNLYSFLKA